MIFELCRASGEERRRPLPGDGLVPHPLATVTHAITIDVPPDVVWPWLVQLGSGRAGWYAYDRIDNGGTPSADRIVHELQRVAAGDVMPWLPGARDGFIVREVVPEHALTLVVPSEPAKAHSDTAAGVSVRAQRASWVLVLEPAADGRTRLIARGRIGDNWLTGGPASATAAGKPRFIERVYGLLAKLPRPLLPSVSGTGHYLMESRMLRGIKRRAEGQAHEGREHGLSAG